MHYLALRSALLAVVIACLAVGSVAAEPPPPGIASLYRRASRHPISLKTPPREIGRGVRAAASSADAARLVQDTGLVITADPSTVDAGRPVTFSVLVTNETLAAHDYRLSLPLPASFQLATDSVVGGVYDPTQHIVRADFHLDAATPTFSFLDSLAGQTPSLPFLDLPALTGASPLPQGVEGDEVALDISLADNLPAFPYMGQSYRTFGIISNGYLVLGGVTGSGDILYENRPLPDGAPPDAMLAPLWTDLDLSAGESGHGEWYADVITGGIFEDYHAYVIQWQEVQAFQQPDSRYSFEVVLILETGDAFFVYQRLDPPLQALTVGAESPDGLHGATWYYNGNPTGHHPQPAQTLRLRIAPDSGGQDSHLVRFQARPMVAGTFRVPVAVTRVEDNARTEAAVDVTARAPAPIDTVLQARPEEAGYARPLLPKDILEGEPIYAGHDPARQLAYYGLFQISLSTIPRDVTVVSATVELMGIEDVYLDPRSAASWVLRLLPPEMDADPWHLNWYQIATSPVIATLGPRVDHTQVGVGRVNRFDVASGDLPLMAARAGQTLTLRVDGAVAAPWRGIFGWDDGQGGHPPALRLRYIPAIVAAP